MLSILLNSILVRKYQVILFVTALIFSIPVLSFLLVGSWNIAEIFNEFLSHQKSSLGSYIIVFYCFYAILNIATVSITGSKPVIKSKSKAKSGNHLAQQSAIIIPKSYEMVVLQKPEIENNTPSGANNSIKKQTNILNDYLPDRNKDIKTQVECPDPEMESILEKAQQVFFNQNR